MSVAFLKTYQVKPEQSNPFGEAPPHLYLAPSYLCATWTTFRPLRLAPSVFASCVAAAARCPLAAFKARPSTASTAMRKAPRRLMVRSEDERELSLLFRSCTCCTAPLS